MKTKLIVILNQCLLNKPIHEFNSINKLINTLEQTNTVFNTIEHDVYSKDDENIFVSYWTDKHILVSVLFSIGNYVTVSNECGCNITIYNRNNIQYNEIKHLINKDNNQ